MALQLDRESFSYVYRYIMRYIVRNQRTACKVMFSLLPSAGMDDEKYKELCDEFGNHIRESLRKSDIFMPNRSSRYFVLLTDIDQASIETVVSNLLNSWRSTHGNRLMILDETEFVDNSAGGKNPARPEGFQIAVVDDDVVNLQLAGRILSKAGFYVAALKSGPALLDYIENNTPSLISLDINMPVMDGVETLAEIRNQKLVDEKTAIIALTANVISGAREEYLSLGFNDYLSKPIDPDRLEGMLMKYLPENDDDKKTDEETILTSLEKTGDTDYLKAHHTELSSLIEEKCKVIRDIL